MLRTSRACRRHLMNSKRATVIRQVGCCDRKRLLLPAPAITFSSRAAARWIFLAPSAAAAVTRTCSPRRPPSIWAASLPTYSVSRR